MRSIERFAKSAGYQVVDWFNDPAVSGADPIESRPGFAALLNRIDGNGVRIVLVEDATLDLMDNRHRLMFALGQIRSGTVKKMRG